MTFSKHTGANPWSRSAPNASIRRQSNPGSRSWRNSLCNRGSYQRTSMPWMWVPPRTLRPWPCNRFSRDEDSASAGLEGSHAQLVLQNLTLQKTHQAYNKENRSKNDRTLLFDGKAQVLSSDDFTAKVSNAAERREAEITRRAENAQRRQSRKEIQAQLEEEWKQIKMAHETAIEEWSAQCQNLKDQGIPKKNWPNEPTRPRKPKPPVFDQAAGDSGNEDDGAEGDGEHNSDA